MSSHGTPRPEQQCSFASAPVEGENHMYSEFVADAAADPVLECGHTAVDQGVAGDRGGGPPSPQFAYAGQGEW